MKLVSVYYSPYETSVWILYTCMKLLSTSKHNQKYFILAYNLHDNHLNTNIKEYQCITKKVPIHI